MLVADRLRMRLALDAASMGTFIWYIQEDRSEPDARMLMLCGLPDEGELNLKGLLGNIVHPDDRERCLDAVARATDPKGDGRLKDDFRIALPDGSVRWLEITGQVHFDGEPRLPVCMAGAAVDVTERRAHDARQAFLLKLSDALRPLEEPGAVMERALRLVAEHFGAARVGYGEDQGDNKTVVVVRNYAHGAPSLKGSYRYEDYGAGMLGEFQAGRTVVCRDAENDPKLSAAEKSAYAALHVAASANIPLLKTGRLSALLFVHFRQPHAFLQAEIDTLADVAERTWEAVERARAAQAAFAAHERQKHLLAELQHRVRNILATVRAIIQRSAQTSGTVEELYMHLDGRIDSLARTQKVITRNPGGWVDLEDMVRDELLAQAVDEGQILIEGPVVQLAPKTAEVLTLAVHELVTNAIKYGALRDKAGRISIVWRTDTREKEKWLRLAWIESGVRILATAPRREGFGAELITRRIPYELEGQCEFEFRPGGLRSTIEFPLNAGRSILEAAPSR